MTDNLDGTYTYNFSVSRPGQITVSILQYTLGGVYQEYYASNNFNGNNAYNSTISDNINFDWGSGIIYSSRAIDVSAKFYFRFKAPISDIITFYIYVDDNTTMSVENNQILASTECCRTFTGTTSTINNQYYRGYVTFVEFDGLAHIQMSWSYSGVTQTIVPSTSLYYPSYVASSPIQVTVTCPSGFSKTTSGGIPQCTLTCGNGVRNGSENCDDGNTLSGDGCSSSCVVESGYTCSGGSASTKDICTKNISSSGSSSSTSNSTSTNACSVPSNTSSESSTSNSSSTISGSSSSCSIYAVSSENIWMASSICFCACFSIFFDLILACIRNRYPVGLYITIEHIQIVTILPIVGTYFTREVKGLFRNLRFSLFGFDFVNFQDLFKIQYNYLEDNETLKYLGFESNSTIMNILGFLCICLLIFVIEILLYRLLKFTIYAKYKCCIVSKIIMPIRNWMCVGFYIRYVFIGILLISISSFHELNYFSNEENRWSWYLSLLFSIFLFIIFLIVIISYRLALSGITNTCLLDELYILVKCNFKAKMFSTLFLSHRLIISILLSADFGLSNFSILISLLCAQSFYLIWLSAVRPYITISANISKIICETSIIVLIALMISYKDSIYWKRSTQYVFMYFITLSSCSQFVINLFLFIPELFCLRERIQINSKKILHNKSSQKYVNQDKIQHNQSSHSYAKKYLKSKGTEEKKNIRIDNFDDLFKPNNEKHNRLDNDNEERKSNISNNENQSQNQILNLDISSLRSNFDLKQPHTKRIVTGNKVYYHR